MAMSSSLPLPQSGLSRKFLTSLTSAILLVLVFCLVAILSLRNVIQHKDAVAFDQTEVLLEVEGLSIALENKVASSRAYLMFLQEDMLQETIRSRAEFLNHLELLGNKVETVEGKRMLAEISAAESEHQSFLEELIERRERGENLAALKRDLTTRLWPLRENLKRAISSFQQYKHELLTEARSESVAAASRALWLTVSLGLFALLTILGQALQLIRMLRRQHASATEVGKSRERFLDLVNHLDHSIVWEAEANPFRFTFVSERSQALLSISGSAWEKDPQVFFDLVPEEDRPEVEHLFRKVLETMTDTRVTHRLRSLEGHTIWVQTGVHPRRNPDGSLSLYGLTMDVTPLKEARQQLQQTQDKFNSIMDNAPSAIYIKDLAGRYVFINRRAHQLMHKSYAEILNKRDKDFLPVAAARKISEDDLQVFRTARHVETEEELKLDGETRTFFTVKFPLKNEDGEVYGLCGISSDVTDRKGYEERLRTSEERLALSIEASGMGIWDWNLREGLIIWNENTEHIFGYPVGTPRRNFLDFEARIHVDDRPQVVAELNRAIELHQEFRQEYRIVRPDGSEAQLISRGRAIYDHDGTPCRMVGVVIDITERKRFEKSLQDAVRVREEVLAVVSHDLRNPLGALLMSAGMIGRKAPDDEFGRWVKGQAEKIKASGQRMNELIEDLLSLAKIDAGHMVLELEPVDLARLTREAIELMAPMSQEKEIRVECVLEDDLRALVDPPQLMRVFTNLLSNAIKFTPQEGLISVRLTQSGDFARVAIKDTGPGIAEHHLANVFDRFWQVQRTAHKGTGLGLAIAKGIVESHQGAIGVESVFGEGATFHFTLPLIRGS